MERIKLSQEQADVLREWMVEFESYVITFELAVTARESSGTIWN